MSDRIVTMRRGRITGEMPGIEANEEKLMELMALDQGPGEPDPVDQAETETQG